MSAAGAVGLAGASGGLLVLTFAPYDQAVLSWIALAPLLVAIHRKPPLVAFLLAYAAGLAFIVGSFYWIWTVPGYNLLDEALLGFYLGGYIALWGLGVSFAAHHTRLPLALVAPSLWVALEYGRSNLGFLSLPWMLLGHTQYLNVPILQIAGFTGVYGVTFIIVLTNVAVAEVGMFLRPRWRRDRQPLRLQDAPLPSVVCTAGLFAATWLYGYAVTTPSVGGEPLKVALIRSGVSRDVKWDPVQRLRVLERYEDLSRRAAATSPQLIVWPETAVPGDVEHHAVLRRRITEAAQQAKTALLVGSSEHAKFTDRRLANNRYNSVYLFSSAGDIVGHYRKIVLVPFGEYEPLKGVVTWPQAVAASMGSLLPGERHTIFQVGSTPFAAVICWEIIFPDLVRRFVRDGARFVVNSSNEAWFAGTAMAQQMLAISVFRAVEHRVPVARSSNGGIAATIDPFGRITGRVGGGDLEGDAILSGELATTRSGTFYTHHGDVFALACVAICLAGGIVAAVQGGRRLLIRTPSSLRSHPRHERTAVE